MKSFILQIGVIRVEKQTIALRWVDVLDFYLKMDDRINSPNCGSVMCKCICSQSCFTARD